jgi:DNA-directed RNA polymerase subunit RPC12/RpoP
MSSQDQHGAGMKAHGAGMKAKSADVPSCPTCQSRMTVKQVSPVLFASGLDDVVFGCAGCGAEVKQTVKRA